MAHKGAETRRDQHEVGLEGNHGVKSMRKALGRHAGPPSENPETPAQFLTKDALWIALRASKLTLSA